MLVILSEINCLEKLNSLGVFPDEFYTDIEKFKARMFSFHDATVIVIFAGNCRFNKKLTIELVKNLMKRVDFEEDRGISHVYVVSDTTIPNLSAYYKYKGSIEKVDIMRGWNSVRENINIWSKLQNDIKKAEVFLSDYDLGDSTKAKDNYEKRHTVEDGYLKLIQVPDVKKMLSLS